MVSMTKKKIENNCDKIELSCENCVRVTQYKCIQPHGLYLRGSDQISEQKREKLSSDFKRPKIMQ